MDIFEEEERERKNKELFIEASKRNVMMVKYILTLIYGIIGTMALVAGLVILFAAKKLMPGLPFTIIGGVFLLVTLIIQLALRKVNYDKRYEKYKERVANGYPCYYTGDMSVRIVTLEKRVKELEEEIDNLKKNR